MVAKRILCTLGAVGLAATLGCAPKQEPAPTPAPEPAAATQEAAPLVSPLMAIAELQPRAGGTVHGTISFTQVGNVVDVVGHVEGAAPGLHGFHLHEVGDCSAADFTSAGGHFNPTGAPHGGPSDAERHAGDLGNIEIGEDGMGHLELTSDMLTVEPGPNSVVGRAVVMHENTDDLVSQPTGNAGGRVACGVIRLADDEEGEGSGDEDVGV